MFLLVAHFRSAVPAHSHGGSPGAPLGPTNTQRTDDPTAHEPTAHEPTAHEPTAHEPRPTDGQTVDLAPAPEGARAGDDGEPVGGDPTDRAAVALLAAQPTTRWVRWAGSTEEAGHRVLVAEFASAADYRRALSPFEVRMTVVPWLSAAEIETSGVFEVAAAAGADVDVGPTVPGGLRWSRPTVTDPGR